MVRLPRLNADVSKAATRWHGCLGFIKSLITPHTVDGGLRAMQLRHNGLPDYHVSTFVDFYLKVFYQGNSETKVYFTDEP